MSHALVNVLIVEDDDIDAMAILRAFKKARIANPTHRVNDGVEALEFLRKNDGIPTPLIVLLDLNMPRMNGLEFLARLRRDPKLKSIIVFVLTTSSADTDMTAAYKQNIAGYVVKNRVAQGFLELVNMLETFWKAVLVPEVVNLPPDQ